METVVEPVQTLQSALHSPIEEEAVKYPLLQVGTYLVFQAPLALEEPLTHWALSLVVVTLVTVSTDVAVPVHVRDWYV